MGKTTVSNMFRELGVQVWCADNEVQILYKGNGDATRKISKKYPNVVTEEGVDKNKLRNLIHQDNRILRKIEEIVHPLLENSKVKFLNSNKHLSLVIFDIPLLLEKNLEHNFDAISLMPTNLYGPGDNYHPSHSHVMAALIRRFTEAACNGTDEVICWGTGSPRREFLHVDDLASAAVFCLETWSYSPENDQAPFLNIGTGTDVSIKELAELIATATGFKGTIKWDTSKPDGTPRKLLDISRAKTLGWQPTISLTTGIQSTINDYLTRKK